uniref:Uncharacterized protein n=1 Tax=viral metagenome TaxID=1070528 RepID=A0A6H1ZD41_9ZZZZ
MAFVNAPIKNTTQDLEDLRDTLISGTTAIAVSLKTILNGAATIKEAISKIELRAVYMSEALKIYNKILENNDAETKTI